MENGERFIWQPDDIEIISQPREQDANGEALLSEARRATSITEAAGLIERIDTYLKTSQNVLISSKLKQEKARLEALASA